MNPTGNLQLPAWAVHLAAVFVAGLGFYAGDPVFMALMPTWLATVLHPTSAFLTYLAVSQVTGASKGR